MTGKENKPENYATVTYSLSKKNATVLTLTQDNNDNKKAKDNSTKNRKAIHKKLKEIVENKN